MVFLYTIPDFKIHMSERILQCSRTKMYAGLIDKKHIPCDYNTLSDYFCAAGRL
jgi:hypothetical protein